MEYVLQLYQLAMIALPVYGFVSLRKRIRAGAVSKKRALLHYAAIVAAPIFAFAAVFLLMIGVEEMAGAALVGEELARTFPLAVVLGAGIWLLGIAVFAIGLWFVRCAAVTETTS